MAEKSEPGRVARFADGRGGPSTFNGVGFQVLVQVWLTLQEVVAHRADPSTTVVVRCESRELVDEGQYGYDVAVVDPAAGSLVSYEVKLAPTKDEILDLLARARRVSEGEGGSGSLCLISESPTRPFVSLTRLMRHAGESVDAESLGQLVRAADDEVEIEFFQALGEDPRAVLTILEPPIVHGQQSLREFARGLARAVAMPGEAENLLNELTVRLLSASSTREAIPLGSLMPELVTSGLLAAPSVTDLATTDPLLVSVLIVLQECPVPLPVGVLAAAADVPAADLEELLGEHVAQGLVSFEDGSYFRAVPTENASAPSVARELVVSTLRELSLAADSGDEAAAAQTPNAHALIKVARVWDDEVVADVFRCFDHASKAFGDLWVTYELAKISTDAVLRVLGAPGTANAEKRWAEVRAQTYICGQAWVYQRTGQLERATNLMAAARELTDRYDDKINRAFTLKCEGRLARMRAEGIAEGAARDELLEQSAELLTAAFPAFEELMETNSRFYLDRGECVALLARTFAVAPDFEAARVEVARAHTLLDARPESKAYADLVILEAEMSIPDEDAMSGDDVDAVVAETRGHIEALERVISDRERAGVPADQAQFNRGNSEITARARVVLGLLHTALDELGVAAGYYQEAADTYGRLRYVDQQDRVLWQLLEISGRAIPEGLLDAFARLEPPEGARLLAIADLDKTASQGRGSGLEGNVAPSPGADDVAFWDALVKRSVTSHIAARPDWEEGRETA